VEQDFDVMVHSGDLLPNWSRGIWTIEKSHQPQWLLENTKFMWHNWVGHGQPLLLCSGNHDFIDPVPIMRDSGIDAHNINGRPYTHEGIRFYGFPWVPAWTHEWNFEIDPKEMSEHVGRLREHLEQGLVDVIVAHSPIYGMLDRNAYGERCGNKHMKEMLRALTVPLPKAYLHGHIHEAGGGVNTYRGMTIMNNALTNRTLTV
jgi:Icc-related predicted phosphoesterase